MKDMRGFLRWHFAGTLRNASFWGLIVIAVAVIAVVTGCPNPIPFYMAILGLVIMLVDAVRWYLRFSYRIYEMERNTIMRELERK